MQVQAFQVSGCGKWTPNPPTRAPSILRAPSCTAILENRGLGMVGEKMGAEGRWRDAGASRWVRHLTAFSEGRGPLGETDILGENGFQGEMFGGFFLR